MTTPTLVLTKPQCRALEILVAHKATQSLRGLSPRSVAEQLWPTSPAWDIRTHGRTGNRNGALGGTMPMNAAKLLHRLVALNLAWQDEDYGFHITYSGLDALAAAKSPSPSTRSV